MGYMGYISMMRTLLAGKWWFIAALLHLAVYARGEDITLKCDEFEQIAYELPSDPFCTVSGFTVSHSQNVKIRKYPLANGTKFMKFYDSRLLYVPFKLFDVFPNLKTLDVSSTEVLEVARNTFSAANNLTFLNMSNNNITTIAASVFVGANNVMRLDLSRNQIADVNEFAFRGLHNLDKLQLSQNKIKYLSNETFVENAILETISLDNNLIEYIEPEVFNGLRRIRNVDLSNNHITRIHPNTFQAAYYLDVLRLANNQLREFYLANKSISSGLILSYNNLTSITINCTRMVRAEHNNITRINIINSVHLEVLHLPMNNITDISNITSIESLQELNLSNNPIGPLNISTLARLRRLHALYLSRTGQRKLTFGMFSKQTKLEDLDLSYNKLNELNLEIFSPYQLNTLKVLLLDGNNLTEIQGKLNFLAFNNLEMLGVSRNRFNCSYLHSILTAPHLPHSIRLIQDVLNDEDDVEHIRDVSCLSNETQTLQNTQQQLQNMSKLFDIMKVHEHRLELCLLLLKIGSLAMVCLALGMIAVRFWKYKRTTYLTRRNGLIAYHSNATVNTSMER